MTISLIAACSENRVIGRRGKLPWRLPADLRRFKSLTLDHPIIMGRRTFDALDGPLAGRTSIIVSRQPRYSAPGAVVCHSLPEAIDRARAIEGDFPASEIFVIGGGEIYAHALPLASRIYLTVVHATIDGDAFFPEFDEDEWTLITDTRYEPDERHEYAYSFRRYERNIDHQRPVATSTG